MKVELIDRMGGDLTVANSARVSFAKQVYEFRNSDKKLVNLTFSTGRSLDSLCTCPSTVQD
jgi:thymidylate synthase (FAD)